MKTIRSLFNILKFLPVAGFLFAGCYTHVETMKDEDPGARGGGDDYAYTDSTSSANDTTGANYFSDDDYRESNYRASFDYYCPPAYIWGSNICYDPWYDECWYPGPVLVCTVSVLGLGFWLLAVLRRRISRMARERVTMAGDSEAEWVDAAVSPICGAEVHSAVR